MTLPADALHIDRVEAFVFRAPVETPVQTSFGIMRDRPAVFVRITDQDGHQGWGEIWCNFPSVGAEHRARLVDTVFAGLLEGRRFASVEEAFDHLTRQSEVLAIQSAEPGPIAQCIAGLDIALWDLAARRAKQPLWRWLGGHDASVAVYASGLNPTAPEALAEQRLAQGYRAFKLKVGFGLDKDLANLRALRRVIGDAPLMVDANQAWDLPTALEMTRALSSFDLQWLEEPLRADRPWSEWLQLARGGGIALAAGENLAGEGAFRQALASGALRVVQPDVAKWGGITACLRVARAIIASGHRYCPHYLGGGVGLLASAHVLVAAGGGGLLEIDANPNPLRSLCCGALAEIQEGRAVLGDAPGLGASPDLQQLEPYARKHD